METDQGATGAQVPPTKEHGATQGFLVEPSSVESPVHCPVWSVHTCGTGVVYTPLGSPAAPTPVVVCGPCEVPDGAWQPGAHHSSHKDLPGHRGILCATAVPLMGRPLAVTHQQ